MPLACSQWHRQYYEVPSGSSSKVYRVKMHPQTTPLPECNCTGFMTKRNKNANAIGGGYAGAGAGLAKKTFAWCKHLEEVKTTVCDWQQAPGEATPRSCPKCGEPVVDAKSPLLAPFRLGGAWATAVPIPTPMPRVKSSTMPGPPDAAVRDRLVALARKLKSEQDAPPKGDENLDTKAAAEELRKLLET